MMDREQLASALGRFCKQMAPNCSSIRVFATVVNGDSTSAITTWEGNYFAQLGQVTDWLASEQGSGLQEDGE